MTILLVFIYNSTNYETIEVPCFIGLAIVTGYNE